MSSANPILAAGVQVSFRAFLECANWSNFVACGVSRDRLVQAVAAGIAKHGDVTHLSAEVFQSSIYGATDVITFRCAITPARATPIGDASNLQIDRESLGASWLTAANSYLAAMSTGRLGAIGRVDILDNPQRVVFTPLIRAASFTWMLVDWDSIITGGVPPPSVAAPSLVGRALRVANTVESADPARNAMLSGAAEVRAAVAPVTAPTPNVPGMPPAAPADHTGLIVGAVAAVLFVASAVGLGYLLRSYAMVK